MSCASLSFSTSFWLCTLSFSHMNLADISPRSGVVMIGTGSNGATHAASEAYKEAQ